MWYHAHDPLGSKVRQHETGRGLWVVQSASFTSQSSLYTPLNLKLLQLFVSQRVALFILIC